MEENGRYCVTGATGYVGSWLVKLLLQRGCMVHATVRDPAKASYLVPKWNGDGRLKLFRADLHDEGSFDDAVKGCDGVFHVAASMEFNVLPQDNIESYVKSRIIEPAIEGTLSLLRSCSRSGSVRRVVLTSSISTITAKDSHGNWRSIADESCQTPIHQVWNARASGWVYVLSKLLTEEAAFQFANCNGVDLVSVITTTVGGPFLTSSVPSSIHVLLSPLTGDPEFAPIMSAVSARMGCIGVVHIEDICNAHIFLMEHPAANGRYLCCAHSASVSELVHLLARFYPLSHHLQRREGEGNGRIPCKISSKKLKDLGFEYKYGVVDIINDTIRCCVECGYLPFNECVRATHK